MQDGGVEVAMFIVIALMLAVAWVLGFTVMKVSSVALHLLILFALASLIADFFRRNSSRA
jgi:hypothetical protein